MYLSSYIQFLASRFFGQVIPFDTMKHIVLVSKTISISDGYYPVVCLEHTEQSGLKDISFMDKGNDYLRFDCVDGVGYTIGSFMPRWR